MIKKYNDNLNVCGDIIRESRESKQMTKVDLCKKLELLAIYIDRNQLYMLEHNQLLIKDFELLAIVKILDIDLNKLKDLIDQ